MVSQASPRKSASLDGLESHDRDGFSFNVDNIAAFTVSSSLIQRSIVLGSAVSERRGAFVLVNSYKNLATTAAALLLEGQP